MIAVASKVAKLYARRCWRADEDDLRQEALVVAQAALRTFDPTKGLPFAAYAWRACAQRLARYLWRSGSPVSAPDHHVRELRGLHGASLEMSEYVDLGSHVGELLDDHRWHSRVREQLTFLFQQTEDAHVAARTLLDDEQSSVVAAEAGIPVARVYRITARAKKLLAASARLHELHTERNTPE